MTDPTTRHPTPATGLDRRRLLALATSGLVALGVAGCGRATGPAQAGAAPGYPRQVPVPGGEPVTLERRPVRIVTPSTDTAECLLELIGADRLVAVPKITTEDGSGNHTAEAAKVKHTFASPNLDPEQVLSLEPDLVVLTTRHQGEKDLVGALKNSKVPVLAITNTWDTYDHIRNNYRMIARAVASDDKADDALRSFDQRLAKVEADRAGHAGRPVTGILLSPGPKRPYMVGVESLTSAMVTSAGGRPWGEVLRMERTVPFDPEQMVRANPDTLVLISTRGRGRADYQDVLAHPALGRVPAVQHNRILVLESTRGSATAGIRIVDGIEATARFLHPGGK